MIVNSLKPALADDVFEKLNSGIDKLAKKISPSGSNGRVPLFFAEVKALCAKFGISYETYMNDAFVRSGRAKKAKEANDTANFTPNKEDLWAKASE